MNVALRKKIQKILADIWRDELDPGPSPYDRPRIRKERRTDRERRRPQLPPVRPSPVDRPPVGGGGSAARDAFVQGVVGRVGGSYCSPPGRNCTDCSGLVAEEYKKATGRTITGSSHHQYDLCTPIKPSEVRAGDLLFHHTFGGPVNGNYDTHVGVAINDVERVDAMNEQAGIKRGPRSSAYWYNTFTRAGRLPW